MGEFFKEVYRITGRKWDNLPQYQGKGKMVLKHSEYWPHPSGQTTVVSTMYLMRASGRYYKDTEHYNNKG